MTDIFISYRRTQFFVVDRIWERIRGTFRRASVFLDRSEIRPGAKFPEEIKRALDSAKIVLVIIGPKWISAKDPVSKKRRLDMNNDWVRFEIERSLEANKIVIPVLVDGARMPGRKELPPSLVALADRNKVSINPVYFAEDLNDLVEEMKAQITQREIQAMFEDESDPYPTARKFRPVAIKGTQLRQMKADLGRWTVRQSRIEDDSRPSAPKVRREIVRTFKFPSFLAAIDFMKSAADRIDPYDHHPRWENIYRTLTVRLSTWDSGHKISDRDYKTALMFEKLYREYVEDIGGGDGKRSNGP